MYAKQCVNVCFGATEMKLKMLQNLKKEKPMLYMYMKTIYNKNI